jgi:hypothetical protein
MVTRIVAPDVRGGTTNYDIAEDTASVADQINQTLAVEQKWVTLMLTDGRKHAFRAADISHVFEVKDSA